MNLRLYTFLLRAFLQRRFVYPIEGLIWAVNGLIGPLVIMSFWVKVSESNPFPVMGVSALVTYYLMSTVVDRITQTASIEYVSTMIKSGQFSNFLIKPFSPLIDSSARDVGKKVYRLVMILPMFLIVVPLFKVKLSLSSDPLVWTYFFAACLLAYMINYWFEMSFSLFAFFTTEVNGLSGLWDRLVTIINGTLVPIAFLPAGIRDVAKLFYARFSLSFPLEIILGQLSYGEIVISFVVGIMWLIFFYFSYRLLWIRGIKKYEAIGI